MQTCCVSECGDPDDPDMDCVDDCDDYAAACRSDAWDGPSVYTCVATHCNDIRDPCVLDCGADMDCEDDCDDDYDACLPYENCTQKQEHCEARCVEDHSGYDATCYGKCSDEYDVCECASDEDECLAACNPDEKAREDFTIADDNCESACRMCLGECYGGDLDECKTGC